MIALLLSALLSQAPAEPPAAPAPEPAAEAPAAPAAEPAAEAPPSPPVAAPVPAPAVAKPGDWKAVTETRMFARVLAATVLGAGAAFVLAGSAGLAAMLALRFTPVLEQQAGGTQRTNLMAMATLTTATGFMLGGVLILAGVVGFILH